MSKREKETEDWRRSSDSLFAAARADHEASAADYARVDAELARRLAAGAPATRPFDGDKQATAAKPARAMASSTIAKLSIAVSLFAAGSLVVLRMVDFTPARGARSADSLEPSSPPPTAAAPASVREASSEQTASPPVPDLPYSPLPRTRSEHAARVGQSRIALRRTESPKRPTVSDSPFATTESKQAEEATSPTTPSRSTPASTDASPAKPSATLQPRAAASLVTPPVAAEASPRPSPQPQTRPEAVRAVSADGRAELALVERMHAAMRAAKPAAALALCAEHARRWPQGMFSEEREAVSAIAACVLHTDDAASRARLFLSKHPRALTAPRVAAACTPLSATTDRQ